MGYSRGGSSVESDKNKVGDEINRETTGNLVAVGSVATDI